MTALQWRILGVLAGIEPKWTLTGGAALAGFYLKHRATKDLDLFWQGQESLGDLPREVRLRLSAAGLEATVLQSAGSFFQLRVSDGTSVSVVDLVADPTPTVVAPQQIHLEGVPIAVDDPQEILTNKLCALLGRAEIRDLVDVKELLSSGADLGRALAEAPRKDAGFSPLTLAWVLKDIRPQALGRLAGLASEDAQALEDFKERLVRSLLETGAPE
ncbi:MAG TPA: nucleotidyl transferase AbiEii/AbiGii toxin family protein [Thermoanaerobaculia bacterium]|nr:nucleotidyl transferase AbiEii/AbiGii toxin family protein [Thermoanaerobaculia bacterium]